MKYTLSIALTTMLFLAGLCFPPSAAAQQDEINDIALPMDDAKAIEIGKQRYGENCSGFCHGAGGKGGRAPCLICGVFKRGGKDSQLFKNIAEGVTGTPMGAFGDKMSKEDIVSLIAYLRTEQKKRAAEQQ